MKVKIKDFKNKKRILTVPELIKAYTAMNETEKYYCSVSIEEIFRCYQNQKGV